MPPITTQRSTGRGGMGNIKRAASNDPLAPIFTDTSDQYLSISGREVPVSMTSSPTETRSTGRGGSGNIGRARARSGATLLSPQTASIIAKREEIEARRERALIASSADARKKNVGAFGRGGAGNKFLQAPLPSASSSQRSIRSSTQSSAVHSIITTNSYDSPLPPNPSHADADEFELVEFVHEHGCSRPAAPDRAEQQLGHTGLNPRYQPRSTLWSKITKKDGKSKNGMRMAAGRPRSSLDERSVLDITAALPAALDIASASFQTFTPPSPSHFPRATRRSKQFSTTPSAYRHAVLFPVEAAEGTASPHHRSSSWSAGSGSGSGTVSTIASWDSYSSPAAWRARPIDTEPYDPSEEEVSPWIAPGGPQRVHTASNPTGALSVRSCETGSAPASDGASVFSACSPSTEHTLGSISSTCSAQTSECAPSSAVAPRPRLYVRTGMQSTAASASADSSTVSAEGARTFRRAEMMLLESPVPPGSMDAARGMTAPSTLTHSLAPSSSLPSSRAAPSPRTPSITLVPPIADEYSSDEADVGPTMHASPMRWSYAPSLSPSIAGASMCAEPSTPSAVERAAFITEPVPLPPVPLHAASAAARPHAPMCPPPPVPAWPPVLDPVPEPHPEREPRALAPALPRLILPTCVPPPACPGARAADASPAKTGSGSPCSAFPRSVTASARSGPSWGELLRAHTGPSSATAGDPTAEWDEEWEGEALPPYTPLAAYNERPLPTPRARSHLAAEESGACSPLRALRAARRDGGDDERADLLIPSPSIELPITTTTLSSLERSIGDWTLTFPKADVT